MQRSNMSKEDFNGKFSAHLQAGSADSAILEPVEFHQIILMVVLIGAVAAVFFSIFYSLLKKLIYSKSAWNALAERTPLVASYQYRGHIIRFEVEQDPDTLYWEAKGVIELIEGKTSRTFIVNGAINTFKTEAEAKHALLQQAKRWVYDHIGS
jgi:hypothetical protein